MEEEEPRWQQEKEEEESGRDDVISVLLGWPCRWKVPFGEEGESKANASVWRGSG